MHTAIESNPLESTRATTTPLTVCLISEEYPTETGWGGIGTYAYNVAAALVSLGHRVHLIVRGWTGRLETHTSGTLTLYRVPIPEPSWRHGTQVVNLKFPETREVLLWSLHVSRVVRTIAGSTPLDVVESPEYRAQGLFVALRQPRLPLVVKLHTPAYLLNRINGIGAGATRADSLLAARLERVLARRARVVTSPSRRLLADVAVEWKLDHRRLHVVPNPVDDDPGAVDRRDRENGLVLYVGRIERRKGLDTLADAIPDIVRRVPGTRFWFVGNDHPSGPAGASMTAHLKRRLEGCGVPPDVAQFIGAVPRPGLFEMYRRATLCVIPSLYENFPYTCLEAMASGCPVVGSDVGGIPEIIRHRVDGLLVPPRSSECLADAIVELLADRALRDRLGRRAEADVRARFGRQTVGEATAEIYASLTGRRRARPLDDGRGGRDGVRS